MAYTTVPTLRVPSLSVPTLKVPTLKAPTLNVPTLGGTLNNSSRPQTYKRELTDIGDILLGNPISGTRELQESLHDHDLDFLTYVPLLNRVAGTAIMMKDRFIDPIAKGNWDEAGINTLETVGNTLDIVANPIKSLMPWAGGGSTDDFLRSMGWKDGEYRKMYQWNTGNTLTDIVGETISDPLNWFSFGANQMAKTASKDLTNNLSEAIVKNVSSEVGDTLNPKVLRNILTKYSDDLATDLTKSDSKVITELTKRLEKQKDFYEAFLRQVDPSDVEQVRNIKNLIDSYKYSISDKGIANLRKAFTEVSQSKNFARYNSIRKVIDTSAQIDRTLLITGLGLNPVTGAGYLIASKGIKPGFQHLWNKAVETKKALKYKDVIDNTPAELKKALTNIQVTDSAQHKVLYDKFEKIFNDAGVTLEQLQDLYLEQYITTPANKLNEEVIKNKFIKAVQVKAPAIGELLNDFDAQALLLKEATADNLQFRDVLDLVDSLNEQAKIRYSLIEGVNIDQKRAFQKSVTDFINNGEGFKTVPDYHIGDKNFLGYTIDYNFNAVRDGSPVGMRNTHDGIIHVNLDAMQQKFLDKAWQQSLRSLNLNYDFKNLDDFIQFAMLHEYAHDYIKREAAETLVQYETRVNNEALKNFIINKECPGLAKLDYLLNNILDSQKLSTSGLIDYLQELDLNNPELRTRVQEYLDYTGLSPSNISKVLNIREQIKSIFNEETFNTNKLSKALRKLEYTLAESRTGSWYTLEHINDSLAQLNKLYKVNNKLNILSDAMDIDASIFKDLDMDLTEYLNSVNLDKTLYTLKQANFTNDNIMYHTLKNNQTYRHLSDINSDMRLSLDKAIDILQSSDALDKGLATKINALLAEIDTTNAYFNLVSEDFSLWGKDSKFINGIISNKIKEYSGIPYSTLKGVEARDNLVTDIVKEIADYPNIDISKDMNVKLYDLISEKINDYFTALDNISNYHNITDIRIGEMLNMKSIDEMKKINSSYEHIVSTLLQNKAEVTVIKDTSDFITGIAGNNINFTYNNISKYLDAYDGSEETLRNQIYELLKTFETNDIEQNTNNLMQSLFDIAKQIKVTDEELGVLKIKAKDARDTVYTGYKFFAGDELDKAIRTATQYTNKYDFSTATGLGFRRVNDPKITQALNIKPETLDFINPETYIRRQAELYSSYNYFNKYGTINAKKAEHYRTILRDYLDTISVEDLGIKPKDINTFINNLSDEGAFAWDNFLKYKAPEKIKLDYNNTRNNMLVQLYNADAIKYKNTTIRDIEGILMREEQGAFFYDEIQNLIKDKDIVPEDAFNKLVDFVNNSSSAEMTFDLLEQDITRSVHSMDNLKQNRKAFISYIANDKKSLDNIRELVNNVTLNDGTIEQYLRVNDLDDSQKRLMQIFKITKDSRVNDNNVQQFLKYERNINKLNSIGSFTAPELRSYLDDTAGIMLFIADHNNYNILNLSDDVLSNAGVKKVKLSKTNGVDDMYIFVSNNVEKPYTKYKFIEPKYAMPELQAKYTELFKNNRDVFEWGTQKLPDELFTGDMMNRTEFENILTDKRISKALKDNIDIEYISDKINNFYTKGMSKPDMNLVGLDVTQSIRKYTSESFTERGLSYFGYSNRLDKATVKGNISAIKIRNTNTKYATYFFNDDLALNGNMCKEIFKDLSDKEIKELFEKEHYVAAVMREHKGKPRVYKMYVTNKKQLKQAQELGAVLLPQEVYRNAVLALNQQRVDSNIINAYRMLASTYKCFMLTSPGFLIRNGLDSAIYKNASSTNGFNSILDNFKYEHRAMRMLSDYDDVYKKAIELGNEQTVNTYYLKKAMQELGYDAEQREAFYLVHIFKQSAASGGTTEALEELQLIINKAARNNQTSFEEIYDKIVFQNPIVKPVRNFNDIIEESSRLGLFLNLVEQGGLDTTGAIQKVVATHFDYGLKDGIKGLVEQVFWFSTFPINNMLYYVNKDIKNYDLLKLNLDMAEQSWNNDDVSWEDVKKSKYLTYNALAGNIRFKWNGKNIILKTGSSVFDFFNLITNPINETGERVNPFIGVLLGTDDINQLNPINPFVSRGSQFQAFGGNSYLPSIYATMYDKRNYNKGKTYKRYNYNRGNWHFNPKKKYVRKPNNKNRMLYSHYNKPYYFSKGGLYKWSYIQKAQGTIEPYEIYRSNKYKRAAYKFQRMSKTARFINKKY